jgi:hypothetical protein
MVKDAEDSFTKHKHVLNITTNTNILIVSLPQTLYISCNSLHLSTSRIVSFQTPFLKLSAYPT